MVLPRNRVWMPNVVFKLMGQGFSKDATLTEYKFRVPPFLTKLEIRDYLEQIYGLDVQKVNTANFMGKERRYKQFTFRDADYKIAIVTLNKPSSPPPTSSEPLN